MTCAFFPAGYKVVFDGEQLGIEIVEYLSEWKLATSENIRHNFWSHTPTIDVTYPALVWEHNFLVYNEKVSRGAYLRDYLNVIRTCITTHAMQLLITNKTTDQDVVALGRCNFIASNQDTPKQFLLYEAGLFRMKFIGTAIPSVVSSY